MDEPTVASELFVKYMASYVRGLYSVKNYNTWNLEKEAHHWIGAFCLVGKPNYVVEGCYRHDTNYTRLTGEGLEWKRNNQLFCMTAGGHAMSMDELNEMLMWWDKGSVTSYHFPTVCTQTR